MTGGRGGAAGIRPATGRVRGAAGIRPATGGVRSAAAVIATALLALSGCGGGTGGGSHASRPPAQGTGAPERPSAEQQLHRLLARRARALEVGDAPAYAATATGPQRARDRRAARNARGLRLRGVSLAAERIDVEGRRAELRVSSRYGVAGVSGRFEAERRVRAVRTAAGWRVRSESGSRRRHPWELAPFAQHRTRHFVVLAPADLPVEELGLPAVLESGYERMRDVLAGGRLRRRYLVVVAADAGQARRMTSGIRGVESLAAISDSAVREQGPAERVVTVASQRLLVVWTRFSPLDEDERRRVVTHELTHAALAGFTSGRTPSWLVEGIALYVSNDRRVDSAARLLDELVVRDDRSPSARATRRALTLTGLSRSAAIARLGGDGQAAAYAYSSAAAFYIADRFGRRGLLDLYDSFNDEDLPGDAGPALTDRALRRALGIPLIRLERDLRRWILTRAVVSPEAP